MGNIRREMETLGKNPKEILEIKGTVADIIISDGLISRLGTSEMALS